RPLGYRFAPDPSSQQACTIGGNVSTNAGGPHCLAYGVTNQHVLAVEIVTSTGELALLGGLDAEPLGLDLRGAFVGGEGTLGIATRIAVRITIAVERYAAAGYPTDAAAVLLVEVDGFEGGVDVDVDRVAAIGRARGAKSVRVAADEHERALLWKGRKTAFGAVAQLAPAYYLHDTVVPRAVLADVLEAVYEIAESEGLVVMNVFHAGDGNLHPLLLFDPQKRGEMERVH